MQKKNLTRLDSFRADRFIYIYEVEGAASVFFFLFLCAIKYFNAIFVNIQLKSIDLSKSFERVTPLYAFLSIGINYNICNDN